jgi:hypothetical protein
VARKGSALLLVAAAAALVAAPSAAAATTRAEYASEANAVCAKYEDQGRKLVKEFPRQPPFQNAKKGAGERFVKKFVRLLRKMDALDTLTIAELKAIPPAPGDESLVADWFTALDRTLDLSRHVNGISVQLMRLTYRLNAVIDENPEAAENPTPKQRRLSKRLGRVIAKFEVGAANASRAADFSDVLANQLGAIECVAGLEDQGTGSARTLLPLAG